MSCNCGRGNHMDLSSLQDLSEPKTWVAISIALSPVLALVLLNSWIDSQQRRRS